MSRPPLPPFDRDAAVRKVRTAEDAWNGRDPAQVSQAYSAGSRWRNRSEFLTGRAEIIAFLTAKWAREHGYRLIKELWARHDDRIAVRFVYEWHDDDDRWFRSHGNENRLFDADGLMAQRHASIDDVAITDEQRLFRWDRDAVRPVEHPGLTALGLQRDRSALLAQRICAHGMIAHVVRSEAA